MCHFKPKNQKPRAILQLSTHPSWGKRPHVPGGYGWKMVKTSLFWVPEWLVRAECPLSYQPVIDKWHKLEKNFKPLDFQDDVYLATVYPYYNTNNKCYEVNTENIQWEFSTGLVRKGFLMMKTIYVSLEDVIFSRIVSYEMEDIYIKSFSFNIIDIVHLSDKITCWASTICHVSVYFYFSI